MITPNVFEPKENEGVAVNKGSIKSIYEKYANIRSPILDRARRCSELTLPSLLPPEGDTQTMVLPTPTNSLGARAVNNLASKLLMALLPPNTPFFRLNVTDQVLVELGAIGKKTEVEKQLNKIEREVMYWLETNAIRVPSFYAIKQLIVTGNCLEYLDVETGKMKVYRLDQYVIKRDPMGNVLEIIVFEKIHPEALPEEVQSLIKAGDSPDQKSAEIYTRIRRENNKWVVEQEINDIPYEAGGGTYELEYCPWLALRWSSLSGEDYGRGLVEEYLGDFESLMGLSKAVLSFAAAASKIVFLTNPGGSTNPETLSKAKSGDFVRGKQEDVTTLQVEKYYDFKAVQEMIHAIESRISYAFLLMSAVQRDAERVTAEEIRQLARELEDSLGGPYAVLSQEKQLPLVRLSMHTMKEQKKLPPLPEKVVNPVIVTGLEALGRGNDLNKLVTFFDVSTKLPNAEMYVGTSEALQRVATSLGLDIEGLVKTEDEVAQSMNQMSMNQLAQGALPGVAQELTKGVMNSVQQQ